MSQPIIKSVWARLLVTAGLAAVLWFAWAPAAHWVPSVRYRVLIVLFISLTFIWRVWPDAAHAFGNFQARLFLTIVYAILVFPIGIIVRLFADPLRIKKSPTQWLDHPDEANDMSWAKRQ
ncbi:MAG TPA: hypothetical protein VGW33_02745 [Terriglobia bacterium]|nr:hypothetical protein [Terriglobia bacterium]